jgi:flavodoxin
MAEIGIFVGTVYGNALLVAEEAETLLKKRGHQVKVFEEGTLEAWQYYRHHFVLVITSTTGCLMPSATKSDTSRNCVTA